jgi:4-carboxymuconolactone decarboxylase
MPLGGSSRGSRPGRPGSWGNSGGNGGIVITIFLSWPSVTFPTFPGLSPALPVSVPDDSPDTVLSVIDEPRLPALNPDELDHEQRDVYEAIVGGPRPKNVFSFVDDEGRLLGPFNVMLYSPAVGGPLQELGSALRFRTGFTTREREIAILVVAAGHRSDYEWYAHERVGRQAGLSEAELTALRTGTDPVLADARERIIHEAARALTTDGDLSAPIFAEAKATLGRAAMVELVTLVGYYQTLALQLRVFRIGVPDGAPRPSWDADTR